MSLRSRARSSRASKATVFRWSVTWLCTSRLSVSVDTSLPCTEVGEDGGRLAKLKIRG